MNKRGQGLPLNTLIIIILVVIVLIVVAVFFLGGTSSLSKSIRNIFYGTTAGTDVTLARNICDQRCEAAQGLEFSAAQRTAYCSSKFNIDENNDGKIAGSSETGKTCYDSPISHRCNLAGAGGVPRELTCTVII